VWPRRTNRSCQCAVLTPAERHPCVHKERTKSLAVSRPICGRSVLQLRRAIQKLHRWFRSIRRQRLTCRIAQASQVGACNVCLHLIRALEERFRALSQITLGVLDQNRCAIDFYRRIGYEFDGVEKSEHLGGVGLRKTAQKDCEANSLRSPLTLDVGRRIRNVSTVEAEFGKEMKTILLVIIVALLALVGCTFSGCEVSVKESTKSETILLRKNPNQGSIIAVRIVDRGSTDGKAEVQSILHGAVYKREGNQRQRSI